MGRVRIESTYPPPAQLGPRAIAAWALRTKTDRVRAEGVGNVPRSGPVMLVARDFHHLLDSAILVRAVPRPLHIVVGLGWARNPLERTVMEWACRAAHYPVVVPPPGGGQEIEPYSHGALAQTSDLLRAGRVVVVFPQAYPSGYLTMLERAESDRTTRVAVVPVGFSYTQTAPESWSVTVRFGEPCASRDPDAIERAVRRLCDGVLRR